MKSKVIKKPLAFLLILAMMFSLLPLSVLAAEVADTADTAVTEVLAALAEKYENTKDGWAAMALAAYGQADEVAGADIIEQARKSYTQGSATDLARSIIILTALGVDATHVYGGSESQYLDFLVRMDEALPTQIMEAVFGLLALDSGEYNDGQNFSRQGCIDFILNKKLEPEAGQVAWSISGGTADVDTTAMVVAALAPHYNTNGEGIQTAVEGALEYLAAQQQSDGHCGNSNATAMTIVALAALGENPGAQSGAFAKDGSSLIDGLLYFRTASDEFGYDDNTTGSVLSTEQGFRALVAYRGYLYAGSKAYNIYQFGSQTGDGTALTGEADPGIIPPDPDVPRNVKVRIEDLFGGSTLLPETAVNVSGTHLDALKAALSANGRDPEQDLILSDGYISSILDVKAGDSTGWMYAVNGEIPVTSLDETQVVEGDVLVLFFIDWFDSFYFTMFDKSSASIIAGGTVTFTLTGLNPWEAMGSGEAYAPISEATLYAYDVHGDRLGTEAVTGTDGKATLTFSTAGTYTVSATRKGALNATDLVPPLCVVTVTSETSGPGEPSAEITVSFELQGLDSGDNAEIWIQRKTVSAVPKNATVVDVIIKALAGTGYTQSGALDGYIKSVTTPGGFTLAETHSGMLNSGWLYKINSLLPTVGMDLHTVKNGDYILLYFTKDYTKDPDAGTFTGGGSGRPEEATAVAEVKAAATAGSDGTAQASIATAGIVKALDEAIKAAENLTGKPAPKVRVTVDVTKGAASLETVVKAEAIKAIAAASNVQLTIESALGSIIFASDALSALAGSGISDSTDVTFSVARIDTNRLAENIKAVVGGNTVFDLSVTVGKEIIHRFDGQSITVSLPYTLREGEKAAEVKVWHLNAAGDLEQVDCSYDEKTGLATFKTAHLSYYVVGAAVEEVHPGVFTMNFTDVRESDWFYAAVQYAVENGFFVGAGETAFSPHTPMTRAMLVTVLHRLESSPAAAGANDFTDVKNNEWYTAAVTWANAGGIVSGYGNDLFGPADPVTREQMAAVLHRYASHKGCNVTDAANLSDYTDAKEISSWAEEAMSWANAEGLLTGRTVTTLVPGGTATRAEVASILQRFKEGLMQ